MTKRSAGTGTTSPASSQPKVCLTPTTCVLLIVFISWDSVNRMRQRTDLQINWFSRATEDDVDGRSRDHHVRLLQSLIIILIHNMFWELFFLTCNFPTLQRGHHFPSLTSKKRRMGDAICNVAKIVIFIMIDSEELTLWVWLWVVNGMVRGGHQMEGELPEWTIRTNRLEMEPREKVTTTESPITLKLRLRSLRYHTIANLLGIRRHSHVPQISKSRLDLRW